ncbi:MAG TPA: NADH-quinone oxidoreductase subunit N [Chthonomonadales bacterium]|nr:NADH-quinone oxidoreductase subunit N [Chthonomonadales bacterium]
MSFTFTSSAADWGRIAPELVLAAFALLMLMVDLTLPQPGNFIVLPVLGLLGVVGALIASIILFNIGDYQTAFNNMVGSDAGSLYAYFIILSASSLGIALSPAYLKRLKLIHQGEYYALMLLGTLGMMIMAAASSFLTIFLGLEMLSLALYILCGFARRGASQESGMKYFLLSSFASAILLYGIALIYGATGNTSFAGIHTFIAAHTNATLLLLIGMGLLIVGFAFKVSAVPFQAWTPDVYDGAPAPVTAFMSVGTKAAALIAFARVFDIVLGPLANQWLPVVWAIAVLTIVGGNILALAQSNLKRLLAYSSIAHAGYLLIGVVAGGTVGIAAILFYLFCYSFLNLGAFGIVSVLERADNSGSSLTDLRGLWYRQPLLAGLLAFFLLALAGFPPMAGFAAKYYIFYAALQSSHPELLIIGVLASVLGMYYYLRFIAAMFMERQPAAQAATTTASAPGPTPVSGRRVSAKLSNGGAATAVAVKATTSPLVKDKAAAPMEEPRAVIGWTTWLALGVSVAGTLLMGTLLAYWLVELAQYAAGVMMRVM